MNIVDYVIKYFDLLWFIIGGTTSLIAVIAIVIIRWKRKNRLINANFEKAVKKKADIPESRKFKPNSSLNPTHEEKYKHHNSMNCDMYLPEFIYDKMVEHVSLMSSCQGIQEAERWNDTAKYYGSVQGISEVKISFTEKPVGDKKIITLLYKITTDNGAIYYYALHEHRSKSYDFISSNFSEECPE